MDKYEQNNLAQSARSFNSSVSHRQYVERGVSRKINSSRNINTLNNAEASAKSYSDYNAEHQAAREAKLQAELDAAARERTHSSERNTQPKAKGSRRFQNRSSKPHGAKNLREGEQPPLIESLKKMAEEKKERRRRFNETYDRSSSGASHVEREKSHGGSIVSDVEYFVPKLSNENLDEINYNSSNRKRKTHNKKPMRMWKKASLTALSLFMVFMLCMSAAVSGLLNRINFVNEAQNQASQSAGGNAAADAEAAQQAQGVDDSEIELPDAVMFDADIENILLIGSDRRNTKDLGRSDAMMILTIDRKHKKIKMVSLLRDLYVKIPGKYGTKLNAAYAVGGVKTLKATIEANLGITVDKYVVVDFNAFRTVVNKIGKANGKGGIKIKVTAAEAHYMCSNKVYGNFPRYQKGAGTYYMNGAEALNYARIRKIDSDFGRTNRQRTVLKQCITEMKSLSYMDLVSMAYSCLEYVTTDISKGELVGLATEAAEIMSYDINQISIPINGSYKEARINSSSTALAANLTVNAKKLTAFIYDDDMTYEDNKKKIVGIYIPDIKGIANSNATTKKAASTTAASSGGTVTAAAKTAPTKASQNKFNNVQN